MRRFCRWMNGGVIAVMTEEVYEATKAWEDLPDKVRKWTYPLGPVFTFVEKELLDHPTYKGVVTGSYEDLERLVKGAHVWKKPFYVPFSTCSHLNGDPVDIKKELRYRTTLAQVLDAFGLEPSVDGD